MSTEILIHKRAEQPRYRVVGESITGIAESRHTGNAFSMFEVLTPPHSGAPVHKHPHVESLYVLEGDLELVTGDARRQLQPGDFVMVPGDTPHAFFNKGDTPARSIELATPCGVEAFFADLDRSFGDAPPEPAALMALIARHGVALA